MVLVLEKTLAQTNLDFRSQTKFVPGLEVFEGLAVFVDGHVFDVDSFPYGHVLVELVGPGPGMSLAE